MKGDPIPLYVSFFAEGYLWERLIFEHINETACVAS